MTKFDRTKGKQEATLKEDKSSKQTVTRDQRTSALPKRKEPKFETNVINVDALHKEKTEATSKPA